jgi:protein-S-isoprenylcysteine O-methyltransferase Ste14
LLGKVEAREQKRTEARERARKREDRAMVLWKVIVFVVASLALGYLSRKPLRHPRSHGFPRFFAWEAIVALVLLNVGSWFHDPLSIHQFISWVLLGLSLPPVVGGLYLLRCAGKPDERRTGPGLIGWEKTTELISKGAFRYIRHPIYSSLLLLAWGVFFKLPSWPGGALVVATTVCLTLTAWAEEVENRHFFGPAYEEYMSRTTRFIPLVF